MSMFRFALLGLALVSIISVSEADNTNPLDPFYKTETNAKFIDSTNQLVDSFFNKLCATNLYNDIRQNGCCTYDDLNDQVKN